MRYPFNSESLDNVSTSAISVDASLRKLICDFLLRIMPSKISIDQSYVEINEGDKPYIEIKIFPKESFNIPFQLQLYQNDFELWIGSEDSVVIEFFNVYKESEYECLRKEIARWLECKLKGIFFFDGDKLYKRNYKYFDGKKFRSLYFETGFIGFFLMRGRKEIIYEPWIA